jgi:hypothetical protein
MGNRPCPCCKVAKEDIHLLGTPEDMKTRKEGRRVDTLARQQLVNNAQELIRDGYTVDSKDHVEPLLKPDGYVPTQVSTSAFS